jgi:hypothetical protein
VAERLTSIGPRLSVARLPLMRQPNQIVAYRQRNDDDRNANQRRSIELLLIEHHNFPSNRHESNRQYHLNVNAFIYEVNLDSIHQLYADQDQKKPCENIQQLFRVKIQQWWIYNGYHDLPAEFESTDQYDEGNKYKKYRIN